MPEGSDVIAERAFYIDGKVEGKPAVVFRLWRPYQVSGGLLYGVVSGVSTLGAFWMIYVAIRYERNPWPFILLACVPYASFWYYHERIKPMRRNARDMTT